MNIRKSNGLQFALICALTGFVLLTSSSPAFALWNPFTKPKPTTRSALSCQVTPNPATTTDILAYKAMNASADDTSYVWTVGNMDTHSPYGDPFTSDAKAPTARRPAPTVIANYNVTIKALPSGVTGTCGFAVTTIGTPGGGGGGGGSTPAPAISVSPTSLSQTITQGDIPTLQSILVANGGQDTSVLDFSITSSGDTTSTWTTSPDYSSTNVFDPSTITLSYLTNLSVGTHTGTITISDADPFPTSNPTFVSVPVTITVNAKSGGGSGGNGTKPPEITSITVNDAPYTQNSTAYSGYMDIATPATVKVSVGDPDGGDIQSVRFVTEKFDSDFNVWTQIDTVSDSTYDFTYTLDSDVGRYKITVTASDDDTPQKTTSQVLYLNVTSYDCVDADPNAVTPFSATRAVQKSCPTTTLTVVAHDFADQPISGANIKLNKPDGTSKIQPTDSSGQTKFGPMKVGTYSYLIESAPAGFITTTTAVSKKLTGAVSDTLKIRKYGALPVSVTTDSGQPVSGASVYVSADPNAPCERDPASGQPISTYTTDAHGQVSIEHLKPDTKCTIFARKEGYTDSTPKTETFIDGSKTQAPSELKLAQALMNMELNLTFLNSESCDDNYALIEDQSFVDASGLINSARLGYPFGVNVWNDGQFKLNPAETTVSNNCTTYKKSKSVSTLPINGMPGMSGVNKYSIKRITTKIPTTVDHITLLVNSAVDGSNSYISMGNGLMAHFSGTSGASMTNYYIVPSDSKPRPDPKKNPQTNDSQKVTVKKKEGRLGKLWDNTVNTTKKAADIVQKNKDVVLQAATIVIPASKITTAVGYLSQLKQVNNKLATIPIGNSQPVTVGFLYFFKDNPDGNNLYSKYSAKPAQDGYPAVTDTEMAQLAAECVKLTIKDQSCVMSPANSSSTDTTVAKYDKYKILFAYDATTPTNKTKHWIMTPEMLDAYTASVAMKSKTRASSSLMSREIILINKISASPITIPSNSSSNIPIEFNFIMPNAYSGLTK